MNNKTILITGCCGFIGSHLVDYFLEKKFRVIGLDNLLTGDLQNIEHHKKIKTLFFLKRMFVMNLTRMRKLIIYYISHPL